MAAPKGNQNAAKYSTPTKMWVRKFPTSTIDHIKVMASQQGLSQAGIVVKLIEQEVVNPTNLEIVSRKLEKRWAQRLPIATIVKIMVLARQKGCSQTKLIVSLVERQKKELSKA